MNSARYALFTNPQISLFSNFFIKNGSHVTIHIFKNYFAIVFFSFQLSAVSKRTLSILGLSNKNLLNQNVITHVHPPALRVEETPPTRAADLILREIISRPVQQSLWASAEQVYNLGDTTTKFRRLLSKSSHQKVNLLAIWITTSASTYPSPHSRSYGAYHFK